MKDHRLFDDIARTLAGPIGRRQAFGRIARLLAGVAVTSTVTPRRALAGKTCTQNSDCGAGQKCCPSNICCPADFLCCGTGRTSSCCNPSEECIGGKCIKKASGRGKGNGRGK